MRWSYVDAEAESDNDKGVELLVEYEVDYENDNSVKKGVKDEIKGYLIQLQVLGATLRYFRGGGCPIFLLNLWKTVLFFSETNLHM